MKLGTKRITIDIPKDTHKKLKYLAYKKDKSVKRLAESAVVKQAENIIVEEV